MTESWGYWLWDPYKEYRGPFVSYKEMREDMSAFGKYPDDEDVKIDFPY